MALVKKPSKPPPPEVLAHDARYAAKLVEAQSQGLPCVATRVSAIPELIRNEVSGLLVESESPGDFARALESCITDPARRAALGEAGRTRVFAEFDLDDNLDQLAAKFGLAARSAPAKRVAAG